MRNYGSRLLVDLAAVVKKYPSRQWFRLAALLDNDLARAQIIAFLRESSTPTDARETNRKKIRTRPRFFLDGLDAPEKLEIELSRTSIRNLREIAKGYDLSFSPKDSRVRLRKKIMQIASRKLNRQRPNPKPTRKREDRGDYERWADMIIGAKRVKG